MKPETIDERRGKGGFSVPSLNLLGDSQTGRQVLREDGRAETVLGIVGNLNRFFLAVDDDERDGGAEGFGLVYIHVLRDAVDEDRPHARVGTFLRVQVSGQDLGALGQGLFYELLVFLYWWRGHEDGRRRLRAVELVHGGLEGLAEGLGDGGVDEDALGRHADLPAVQEGAGGAAFGGGGEVGVFEDDGGGLAAEFHEDGLQVLAGLGGDDAAYGGAAGVVDFLYEGVLDDGACYLRGVLGAGEDEVYDSVRKAGGLQYGSDGPEAAWR